MSSALVVDDDPIHTEVAVALLKARGRDRILTASNGGAAERVIKEEGDFDLLLLDINMPDVDGVEFLGFLRQMNCRAPIIICSGALTFVQHSTKALAKSYGLNFKGFIEKPLTGAKLDGVLAEFAAR